MKEILHGKGIIDFAPDKGGSGGGFWGEIRQALGVSDEPVSKIISDQVADALSGNNGENKSVEPPNKLGQTIVSALVGDPPQPKKIEGPQYPYASNHPARPEPEKPKKPGVIRSYVKSLIEGAQAVLTGHTVLQGDQDGRSIGEEIWSALVPTEAKPKKPKVETTKHPKVTVFVPQEEVIVTPSPEKKEAIGIATGKKQ